MPSVYGHQKTQLNEWDILLVTSHTEDRHSRVLRVSV